MQRLTKDLRRGEFRERNENIFRLRSQGRTYKEIGDFFCIRPERVRQICVIKQAESRRRNYLTLAHLQAICQHEESDIKAVKPREDPFPLNYEWQWSVRLVIK